jgi:hypothetical protein
MQKHYVLRDSTFRFGAVLKETISDLSDRLEILPAQFDLKVDNGAISLCGRGDLEDFQIEELHLLLEELGGQCGHAAKIEERIDGERHTFFVGPSDTAINMLRRRYLEPSWKTFMGSVRSVFREFPGLVEFRVSVVHSQAGEWLTICSPQWDVSAKNPPSEAALLEVLCQEEIGIDLELVDGHGFHREDLLAATAQAGRSAAPRPLVNPAP